MVVYCCTDYCCSEKDSPGGIVPLEHLESVGIMMLAAVDIVCNINKTLLFIRFSPGRPGFHTFNVVNSYG